MSKRNFEQYLVDILANIEDIIQFTKDVKNHTDFSKNKLIVNAVTRSLEIIGEAARKIPPVIQKQNRAIQWREISDFRNVLIHAYFDVDTQIVWMVIKKRLPKLKKQITALLK